MSGSLGLKPLGRVVLGTAATTIYTSPANVSTLVRALTFNNVSSGAITVTLQIVQAGGAGTLNLLTNYTIPASSSYVAREALNQSLAAGDALVASASTAGEIHAVASGATQ